MNFLKIIFLLLLMISCKDRKDQFLTESGFILMEEKTSPNKKHKIIVYQFDQGALGESRIFWAILPNHFDERLPINDYIIPDGYKTLDWTSQNEVIIEKWEPYYYKDEEVDLKSGDIINQVPIIVK